MSEEKFKKDIETINIRGEEIEEILGKEPNWIIYWGTVLIFIVLILLLIGSYFFKYPSIFTSKIVIIAENIPDSINPKTSGKITLSVAESLKIKRGQNVNVKIDVYPYMEYGILKGIIKSVSFVQNDNCYIAEVEFPEGLISNYRKKIEFRQGMQGTAEIITDEKRLIEYIFVPFKNFFKK